MVEQPRDRVNLLDLAAFIGRWRTFLVSAVLIVAVIVGGISFLLRPKFRSTAIIKAAESSSSTVGALLSSKLAALGGITSGLGSAMNESPGHGFISLLKSRSLSQAVIDSFDLRTVYKLPDAPFEDVMDALQAHTSFEMDIASAHLAINVDDTDPERAKAMADFYVRELDRRNRSLTTEHASKEKVFMGGRLAEAQASLAALEDSMADFQSRTGLVNVQEQVKATIQASATLEAQRLALQSELDLKRQIFAPDSPEIEYLEMQVASIDRSIQDLLIRDSGNGANVFLPKMQEVPSEGKAYLRLMRDIETQQLLVAYLLQQYEQAKIDELRDTPTLVVLDNPVIPTRKIWPRRGLMTVIAALSTLVLAGTVALVIDFFRRTSNNPDDPNHARLTNLRDSWARRATAK